VTGICRAFDAWLDQGMPEPNVEARAHAATCARCARALDAARALERVLALEASPAPRGFTEAVMGRLAPRAAAGAFTPSSLAWWLRAAAQPSTALAMALAAVVLAGRKPIAEWALAGSAMVAQALAQAVPASLLEAFRPPALPALDDPFVRFGLAVGLAPIVVLASLALHAWGARSLAGALRPR
jgi:hypothetical protein